MNGEPITKRSKYFFDQNSEPKKILNQKKILSQKKILNQKKFLNQKKIWTKKKVNVFILVYYLQKILFISLFCEERKN